MPRREFSRATESRCPWNGPARRRVARGVGRAAIVLFAACAGLARPARATTLTVSPSGAGQFLTIQDAINAAAAGDTLRLLPGVHEALTVRNFGGGVIRKAIAWIDKPLHFIGDVTSIVRGDNRDETFGFWSDSAGPQSFEGMQVWNIGFAFRCIGGATIRRVMWNNVYNGVALEGPNAVGQIEECEGYRTRRFGIELVGRARATILRCEITGTYSGVQAVWATGQSTVVLRECTAHTGGLLQLDGGSTGDVVSCSAVGLEGVALIAIGEGTRLTVRATHIEGKVPTQGLPCGLISDAFAYVDAEWLNFRNCHTSVIFTSRGTWTDPNSMPHPGPCIPSR